MTFKAGWPKPHVVNHVSELNDHEGEKGLDDVGSDMPDQVNIQPDLSSKSHQKLDKDQAMTGSPLDNPKTSDTHKEVLKTKEQIDKELTDEWSRLFGRQEWRNSPIRYENKGWICPVCGAGNSPSTTRCGCVPYPVIKPNYGGIGVLNNNNNSTVSGNSAAAVTFKNTPGQENDSIPTVPTHTLPINSFKLPENGQAMTNLSIGRDCQQTTMTGQKINWTTPSL